MLERWQAETPRAFRFLVFGYWIGGIAEEAGPFGEGAAVAALAGGLPTEARWGDVAFAA